MKILFVLVIFFAASQAKARFRSLHRGHKAKGHIMKNLIRADEGDASMWVNGVMQVEQKIEGIATKLEEVSTKVEQVSSKVEQVDSKVEEVSSKVIPKKLVRLNDRGQIGASKGRVQVWHEGEWGAVCDDSLRGDYNDGGSSHDDPTELGGKVANVVCRSLGYTSGSVTSLEEKDQGRGAVAMDAVSCNGDEASLLDCNFTWGSNCKNYEAFTVTCSK